MDKTNFKDFSEEFHSEINTLAHADQDIGAMKEEIFVEQVGRILEENGEVENFQTCHYQTRGVRIDGYGQDDELKSITLVTSIWHGDADTTQIKVTNTDINKAFKRAYGFFQKSSSNSLNIDIGAPNEAFDLAQTIGETRKEITNLKIVLVTDGLTKKVPARVESDGEVEITYLIWDLERIYNYVVEGKREPIKINFKDTCVGSLNCIVQKNANAPYTTYLAFIPADALADFYKQWGITMLEMNVRVFLSIRGKINKGIKETIKNEPEMFCAYNNGITVFAKSVQTDKTENGLELVSADEFQIVNGGQTTASLYHAREKDKADLSKIRVQMKLTVIHEEDETSKLIPLISKYSNTQNSVQRADFAANEKPHPELQKISNNILAPDPTGGSVQTYWFYDRARGSYNETKNLTTKTLAQKKQFDALRPKNQTFDKIKFAKAWNSWKRLPFVVSKGAQGNFAEFNDWLSCQEEDWEAFFKKTITLLILWNETERIVRKQSFLGYRHNIVTYTISLFVELSLNQFNMALNLQKIWDKQQLQPIIKDTLEDLAQTVNKHIRNTNLNVTEYCKKEACWESLKKVSASLNSKIENELGATKPPPPPAPHESLKFCLQIKKEIWWNLSKWLKDNQFLTGKARSQCANMAKTLGKNNKPSEVLSRACQKIWDDSRIRGFVPKEKG